MILSETPLATPDAATAQGLLLEAAEYDLAAVLNELNIHGCRGQETLRGHTNQERGVRALDADRVT